MNRILAAIAFKLLAGAQQILIQSRRTIDGLMKKSECLGHSLATRLLATEHKPDTT